MLHIYATSALVGGLLNLSQFFQPRKTIKTKDELDKTYDSGTYYVSESVEGDFNNGLLRVYRYVEFVVQEFNNYNNNTRKSRIRWGGDKWSSWV